MDDERVLEDQARKWRGTSAWVRVRAVILTRSGRTAAEVAEALGCFLRSVRSRPAAYRGGPAPLRAAAPAQARGRAPAPRPPRRRPDARRRRLHPAGRGRPPHPRRGVRCPLLDRGRLQAPAPARLQQPGPSARAPQGRPGGAGGVQKGAAGRVAAVAAALPAEWVEVFFQDEVRFGQDGSLTRVWAPTGSRPTAVRQAEYESLQVFTAACPATGRAVGLIAERVDTETTDAFLSLMSESLEPGVRAILIWDNSGAHTSGSLAVPANITLLPLPPYSPELNPVERLWHYLRSHSWSNSWYADYEVLEEAAVGAWRAVCLDRELVKSICAAPYLHGAGT